MLTLWKHLELCYLLLVLPLWLVPCYLKMSQQARHEKKSRSVGASIAIQPHTDQQEEILELKETLGDQQNRDL